MEPQRFDVRYTLTNSDYRVLMDAYCKLTPFRRWRVLFLQALPVAAGAFGAYAWWRTGATEALGLVVLTLSAPIIAPAINNWTYDRAFRRLGLGDSEVHLVADADGLNIASAKLGESRIAWSAVRRVTRSAGRVLLWLNPYQAVIVPAAAFATSADAERFADFAETARTGAPIT